ncbi:hypothetical protein LX32DRAFT_182475 [Colletotrichum zoysiae]|uniref:Uncharacterized protein n=1 Tax=Colletotrichum zoysiae TaxID=1216348 RepID=A0AAD9M389_9PEZI|nr:hypothetical protein LX32DRAFT_182475 [Colletotrichum zoysiae]
MVWTGPKILPRWISRNLGVSGAPFATVPLSSSRASAPGAPKKTTGPRPLPREPGTSYRRGPWREKGRKDRTRKVFRTERRRDCTTVFDTGPLGILYWGRNRGGGLAEAWSPKTVLTRGVGPRGPNGTSTRKHLQPAVLEAIQSQRTRVKER